MKLYLVAFFSLALAFEARPCEAQTQTLLYNFCPMPNCADGADPSSSLTFDSAGNLYGTTGGGGLGYGTVYKLTPTGSSWNETVLYSFKGKGDGASPVSSNVVFDKVGNIYGTANEGGAHGYGVVFRLSPEGTKWVQTVLYSFTSKTGGVYPTNGVVLDSAGNVYGTDSSGVFELSPSGSGWAEQVIYSVGSLGGGITMDSSGNIFGVGRAISGAITVYELSPNDTGGWQTNVLHTFGSKAYLSGTPTLDQTGNLYITIVFPSASGKIYELSPEKKNKWEEKLIYSFKHRTAPYAGVVLDGGGNIFGITEVGDKFGGGIYELTPEGDSYQEKVLSGINSRSSLILDIAGNVYGTSDIGGSGVSCINGCGFVFEVTP